MVKINKFILKNDVVVILLMFSFAAFLSLFQFSCTSSQVKQDSNQEDPSGLVLPLSPKSIHLSWEEGHPERSEWTEFLLDKINLNLGTYESASDMKFFCPKWDSISQEKRIIAASELLVAMSFYESSWNQNSKSVDVGTNDDRDTWSIGLFQMSVVDQKNYNLTSKYSFDDLLLAKPNIDLATTILQKQIKRRGKILISKGESGVYWAVIHPGGKYDKSKNISERVQKYAKYCN